MALLKTKSLIVVEVMVPSYVVGMSLILNMATSLSLMFVPDPPTPLPGVEIIGRVELQRTRRARAIIEGNIALLERVLKAHPEAFTLEQSSRIRRNLEKMRSEVEELRKHEKAVLHDQPGGILAPPPREAKK